MTISHPSRSECDADAPPFVFAELMNITCSICAPNTMTKSDVEKYAGEQFPGEPWESIDKSSLGLGSATPNSCNVAPKTRTHWFMMRENYLVMK